MNDRAAYANANATRLPLADKSVHMIATSPPYWGLRSYDTGPNKAAELGAEKAHDCLAWARGDDPCGACYVCNMRTWAREMWRVLRDDGVMFLNLGDSYSTGKGSDRLDVLNRLIEGSYVIIRNASSIASAAHCVDVPLDDQRTPDGVLFRLFASERVGVDDGDNYLGQVLHLFRSPSDRGTCALISPVMADVADTDTVSKILNHGEVIGANLDSQRKAIFGVFGMPGTWSSENNETSLTINKTNEPGAEGAVVWHSRWDTFAGNSPSESAININTMNNPIPFGYGLDFIACNSGDFRITKATEQEVFLSSVSGGHELRISNVGHLLFSFADGSIIPYNRLHKQATAQANAVQPKQEMGIPDSVKKALQADGWICRSTIIWAKPNPMPESVTDRPTKAHEYVFLLTKSARYFWDAEAVREPHSREWGGENGLMGMNTWAAEAGRNDCNRIAPPVFNPAGRNIRTVWNIATAPYSGAHYATWPPALVERMVKAGSSEHGVCPECGAPWQRVVDKGEAVNAPRNPNDALPYTANGSTNHGNGATTLHKVRQVETVEWRPTCTCNRDGLDLQPDDFEIIPTPTGSRAGTDPSLIVGRAGYSRPRGDNEGQRPITRYEQRHYARQIRQSADKAQMANEAGPAFSHYVRTDSSGARPIPQDLLDRWIATGWLGRVVVPEFRPHAPVPAIVLDPFCGSGTTLEVARRLGRIGLGFDLSETYLRDNAAVRLGHDKLAAWGRGIVDTGDYSDLFRARPNGHGATE